MNKANYKSRPISIGGDFTIDAHIFNAVGASVVAESRKAYRNCPNPIMGKSEAFRIIMEAMNKKIWAEMFPSEARRAFSRGRL